MVLDFNQIEFDSVQNKIQMPTAIMSKVQPVRLQNWIKQDLIQLMMTQNSVHFTPKEIVKNAMEPMIADTAVTLKFYLEDEKDCKIHGHESCKQEAIRQPQPSPGNHHQNDAFDSEDSRHRILMSRKLLPILDKI